jgi:hypothetical protein
MLVKLFLIDYSKKNPCEMMVDTKYKGSRVMAEPYDASLMDSNWIHGPSGQNSGTTPKMVLEIDIILMIADASDFSLT